MSKETKHTPGPWKIDWTFNTVLKTPASDDHAAMECMSPWIKSADDKILSEAKYIKVYDTPDQLFVHDLDQMKANAKLIAAAPDLLEALTELVKEVEYSCAIGSDPTLINLCKRRLEAVQAIAKATE